MTADAIAHDERLADEFRVVSRLFFQPVCLCSGAATLPYVTAIREGLSMNGRIIIHQQNPTPDVQELVQQQVDLDIRIAGHCQELASFCRDIDSHRVHLLAVDVGEATLDGVAQLLQLLDDRGLAVVVGIEAQYEALRERFAGDYFFAQAGADTGAVLLSRKGSQQKLRRNRVRRHRRTGSL